MKCRDIAGNIENFREDRVDSGRRKAILDHLAGCPKCRQLLTDLDAVEERLERALDRMEPSPDFVARVTRAAAQMPAPRVTRWQPARWRPAWWQTALAAACLLAVAGVGWILTNSPGGKQASVRAGKPDKNTFCEPKRGSPFAIGPAFVIGKEQNTPYPGKTSIRVAGVAHGGPELMVEAFPDGS